MNAGIPRRGTLRGPSLCVAADHPLAAQAGLRMLHEGGTAADAAVAMAAVMTVVQPQHSHLGGDLFALTFDAATGEVAALNSSGPSPAALDPEVYRQLGRIPDTGALAVTVPGCVDGWWQLHQRHGRLPWPRLFEAATSYARDGFPASRKLAQVVPLGRQRCYPASYFKETFGGVAGDGGQGVVQPDLARTFDLIAAGGRDAFYEGDVAEAAVSTLGAPFTKDDWRPPARWEVSLSANFAGFRMHTQPPPSQGFVLPLALRVYEQLLQRDPATPLPLLQHRALSSAFAVRAEHAGDPDHCSFRANEWLADDRVEDLAGTPLVASATPVAGDTTYMLAIDADGNAISLIQSVFAAWGSGVFVPGTGILLNNRMWSFDLHRGHPNEIAPAKRPLHTLHCYLVTLDPPPLTPLAEKTGARPLPAEFRAVGGTPGGMQQPQTNLQVLDQVLRLGADPQDALDTARWSLDYMGATRTGGRTVSVEARDPDTLAETFGSAGFEVEHLPSWDGRMGRAYYAGVGPAGLAVAADLRGEGLALVG